MLIKRLGCYSNHGLRVQNAFALSSSFSFYTVMIHLFAVAKECTTRCLMNPLP